MGVTNKTFQLAKSFFSFHVEMFFFTRWAEGKPINKQIETWKLKCIEPMKRSNQNPQEWNMAFQVKIHFCWLWKVVFMVSSTAWKFYRQYYWLKTFFKTTRKVSCDLKIVFSIQNLCVECIKKNYMFETKDFVRVFLHIAV